ncbi:hypothetical protein [Clostridium sp. CF012]|uniref:hypothetical protein n=1 Tax=Clostridium sp. CF012 TaxID=2843319 RepID=UPI001C0AD896|nr:hypothetical protein [Clostridium sp. CF012]MBU3145968.1 hypothetical protein [Clostridium sp. CF012]
MKLRHPRKYILYMVFICCIALLSINFTNNGVNRIEDKTSRIIIKTIEKEYGPDSKDHNENGGIRTSTPVTNGNTELHRKWNS